MKASFRRFYGRIASTLLSGGDVARFGRLGLRFWDVARAARAGRAPKAPLFATVFATFRCNHDCAVCPTLETAASYRAKGRAELDAAGMRALVDEIADLGAAAVSFTGGEPLLRKDLEEIIAHARARRLWVHLNTNGFLLDEARARSLVAAGVDSVNLSLDGDTAALHDDLRRAKGSFEGVRGAVAHLRAARGRRRRPSVTLVGVLGGRNALAAPRIAALAREWGADGAGFIPAHGFQANGGLRLQADPASDAAAVSAAVAALKAESIADNSPAYLDLFARCLSGEPLPFACWTGYASMTIDCFGNRYRCFPYGLWGIADPSVSGGSLAEAWRSPAYQALRQEMESCGECYWNCHAELGLLLDRFAGKGRSAPRASRQAAEVRA